MRRHPLLRSIALITTAVAAFTVAGTATAYSHLQGNIDAADVDALLGTERPTQPEPKNPDDPNAGRAITILLLGSDSRVGSETVVDDGVEGERSDTTMVVHLSADRSRIEVVSIPRDSLVDIPSCTRSDGSESWAQTDAMFNEAFSIGGASGKLSDAAACTQKTVESLTGVYIDDFVVVEMAGFVDMIDAVGGVPMCIEEDIDSPKADLTLSAGFQTLNGDTAVKYVRARTGEGLGDGSDLSRIGRQQEFVAALSREVLDSNLLSDLPSLYQFLDAATSSLTISKDLASIPDLAGLAYSIRNVSGESITLMTIPYATAPSDRNRVVWAAGSDEIWARMAADEPIVDEPEPTETSTAGSTEPSESTTSDETAKPGVDPFTADDVTSVCG